MKEKTIVAIIWFCTMLPTFMIEVFVFGDWFGITTNYVPPLKVGIFLILPAVIFLITGLIVSKILEKQNEKRK